jgi:nucleoside-diphosphate-sugar epimerase
MYGLTKVHQELLGDYYAATRGLDYRSLRCARGGGGWGVQGSALPRCQHLPPPHTQSKRRLPGIISAGPPGGGTTDYAVHAYAAAAAGASAFTCFLSPGRALPFLYLPDVLEGFWALMAAPAGRLTRRTYNVGALSLTPGDFEAAIAAAVGPGQGFALTHAPDYRDDIAAGWPESLDDGPARADWGWAPCYGLPEMTADMLARLRPRAAAAAAPEPLEAVC